MTHTLHLLSRSILAAAPLLLLAAPSAHASGALATKYACAACHQADKKVVGPSWKDIATKYRGQMSAEALAASIKKGSTGKWGPMPMPAQAHVPDADLAALAAWVLSGAQP